VKRTESFSIAISTLKGRSILSPGAVRFGVKCQTFVRDNNIHDHCSTRGRATARVFAEPQDFTSPNMPTNAEAGPEINTALIYSFRPRCLPGLERGYLLDQAYR
jgi:hypothetical protein